MAKETNPDGQTTQRLSTSREPVAPQSASKGPGSVGDTAFNDIVIMLVVIWALLFLLVFSTRRTNI